MSKHLWLKSILLFVIIKLSLTDKNNDIHSIHDLFPASHLSSGHNLRKLEDSGVVPENHVKNEGTLGIVLEIENYSNLKLTDADSYQYSGYKDNNYGHLHDVEGGQREIFIFHNKKWTIHSTKRRSAGSVSWLFLDKNGIPLWKNDRASRIHLLWELPTYFCHERTTNYVKAKFYQHSVHENSFITKQKYQQGYYDQMFPRKEMNVSFSKEGHLWVRATIEQGCTPLVKIQIASTDSNFVSNTVKNPVLDVLKAGFDPTQDNFSLMTAILYGLGLLVSLAILGVIIKLFIKCCKREETTYRSGEKEKSHPEYLYHMGNNSDNEETEDELTKAVIENK